MDLVSLYQVADSLNVRQVRGRTREGDVQSPRPTGGSQTAETGGFWVKESDGKKKKKVSLWLCVRVLACALKAKEMICKVIKMSPSADGSP